MLVATGSESERDTPEALSRRLRYLYLRLERNEVSLDDAINRYRALAAESDRAARFFAIGRERADELRQVDALRGQILNYVVGKRRERDSIQKTIAHVAGLLREVRADG